MTDKSLDHELHVAVLGRMREFTDDISEIAALDAAIEALAAHRGEVLTISTHDLRVLRALYLAVGLNPDKPNTDALLAKVCALRDSRLHPPQAQAGAGVLTCVYCGHEYPQDTPAAGDKVLTDHIRICASHPLRAAEATIEQLRSALVGLVGVSEPDELRQMEVAMRLLTAPDEDKAVTINAIHALLATAALEASHDPE